MKLKTINTLVLLVLLAVFAVTNTASADPGEANIKTNIRVMEMKDMRKDMKDARNNIREEKKEDIKNLHASTSSMLKGMIKRDIKTASSSENFRKNSEERKEIIKKMKKEAFEIRKAALVKQLNITLENLVNIRARISERIAKLESEGQVVTEAKTLLSIADDKLSQAKLAIDTLSNFNLSNNENSGSTSDEVELTKPRQVGDAAIKAVKEAKEALRAILKALMPLHLNATTTNSVN